MKYCTNDELLFGTTGIWHVIMVNELCTYNVCCDKHRQLEASMQCYAKNIIKIICISLQHELKFKISGQL